jgi:hypothetical protein
MRWYACHRIEINDVTRHTKHERTRECTTVLLTLCVCSCVAVNYMQFATTGAPESGYHAFQKELK